MKERLSQRIKQRVRQLRKEQTRSEAVLWKKLRDRKLAGKKFLRQHPIVFEWEGREKFVVPDFYCHETGLIIELDGSVHDKRKEHDEIRDSVLNCLGFKVLRFKNKEVEHRLSWVLKTIENQLASNPSLVREGSLSLNLSKRKSG